MSTESNNTPVDPRVQIELEKLNEATDNINKYEVELDEAKCEFKRILAESVVKIKQSAHKLGNSIDAAKPYYESRIYASQLAKETQQAAANYEKAKSIHAAAKEMVNLAEKGLGEKSTLDTACQEMLSHAASKVNQSQLEVTAAINSLKMCQLKLEVANNRCGKLQSQLRQAIRQSRPYYETRANYNGRLKAQKVKINELESKVSQAKLSYNEALKNLEEISEEIHRKRQEHKNSLNAETTAAAAAALVTAAVTSDQLNDPLSKFETQKNPSDLNDFLNSYENASNNTTSNPININTRRSDVEECPQLLQNFDAVLTFPEKLAAGMHKSASISATSENIFAHAQLHGPYEVKSNSSGCGSGTGSNSGGCGTNDDNDIEQWTEIRLSHSESTSSSYSNQSLLHDQHDRDDVQSQHSSSSSSDEPKRKVTCTTIFQEDQLNKKQGLSQWLSRSNSFKSSGRRQSLDLLIDASDKVKDVFSLGFQKVGRTLERRNSESEMNKDDVNSAGGKDTLGKDTNIIGGGGGVGGSSHSTMTTTTASLSMTTTTSSGDFFLFSRSSEPKEPLSDEQVENLLLNPTLDENGTILVEELKSTLQQPHNQIGAVGALLF